MSENIKKSFASLVILQVSGYVIPLVIFPWLTRALGVDGFGVLGFVTAVLAYFVMLVEWGFALGSTSAIASLNDESVEARSRIFFETLYARIGLLFVVTLLLMVLVISVDKLNDCWHMYVIGWLALLNAALSPLFYFQGIHKISVLAIANFAARLISIPLLMVFVHHPSQVALAMAIQMIALIAPTLWGISYLARNRMLVRVRLDATKVLQRLKKGVALFISTAGVSLLTNSNVVVVGFILGDAATGYFVAAFTLVKSATNLLSPFGQVLFPRAASKIAEQGDDAAPFLRKALLVQCGAGAVLSLAVWAGGWFAVEILYGESFETAKNLVALMAPLPLLIAVATFFGTQILIPMGESRYFSMALLLAGVLNVGLMFALIPVYQLSGAAISVVLSELSIALFMMFGCRLRSRGMWNRIVGAASA